MAVRCSFMFRGMQNRAIVYEFELQMLLESIFPPIQEIKVWDHDHQYNIFDKIHHGDHDESISELHPVSILSAYMYIIFLNFILKEDYRLSKLKTHHLNTIKPLYGVF